MDASNHKALTLVGVILSAMLLVALGGLVCVMHWESVLGALYGEETVYAPGYSYERWGRISAGQTAEDVEALLGEPLEVIQGCDGNTRYLYSGQGPRDTSYRMRIVTISPDGVVLKTTSRFYFD